MKKIDHSNTISSVGMDPSGSKDEKLTWAVILVAV
jgi:hypothetical protein